MQRKKIPALNRGIGSTAKQQTTTQTTTTEKKESEILN
jgi:hypothetical protein